MIFFSIDMFRYNNSLKFGNNLEDRNTLKDRNSLKDRNYLKGRLYQNKQNNRNDCYQVFVVDVLRRDDFRQFFDVITSASGGAELDEVVGHLFLVVIVTSATKKSGFWQKDNLVHIYRQSFGQTLFLVGYRIHGFARLSWGCPSFVFYCIL